MCETQEAWVCAAQDGCLQLSAPGQKCQPHNHWSSPRASAWPPLALKFCPWPRCKRLSIAGGMLASNTCPSATAARRTEGDCVAPTPGFMRGSCLACKLSSAAGEGETACRVQW